MRRAGVSSAVLHQLHRGGRDGPPAGSGGFVFRATPSSGGAEAALPKVVAVVANHTLTSQPHTTLWKFFRMPSLVVHKARMCAFRPTSNVVIVMPVHTCMHIMLKIASGLHINLRVCCRGKGML